MPTVKSKSTRSTKAHTPESSLNFDELFGDEELIGGGSSASGKTGSAKAASRPSIRAARKSSTSSAQTAAPAAKAASRTAAGATGKAAPKAASKAKGTSTPDISKGGASSEKSRRTLRSVSSTRVRPKNIRRRTFVAVTEKVPENVITRVSDFLNTLWRFLMRGPLVLMVLLLIWMFIEANVLQLKSAEVSVRNIPYSFRGTKVLYISDIHLSALNSPGKVDAMLAEIMQLEPDLLLLGGDYTASPLISGTASHQLQMRNMFFRGLAQYNPPLGKYAVAGELDNRLDGSLEGDTLRESMALGGVTLLRNEAAYIHKNNEYLILVGSDDWESGQKALSKLSSLVSASDCVILLCHNPEYVPTINSYATYDGFWVDLALCGHTHGGYVSIGGFEPFNTTRDRARFSAGWHKENTAKVLVSRGVANPLLPLRFFASPEAHLITLK